MAWLAFSFALSVLSVESFQCNTNFPLTIPCGRERHGISRNEDAVVELQASSPNKEPKYDMGIGKNKPVMQYSSDSSSHEPYSENAGEFIVEHEAVHDYPVPLQMQGTADPKQKNLPQVQPERRAQHLLAIDPHPVGVSDNYPVMVPMHDPTIQPGTFEPLKLDPNTVWVEMMLHDEMTKCVACN